MENFIRDTVLSGVDLIYLGTDKFKTGYLTVSLVAPLTKQTVSRNAVLPSVLRRGTATYPDMEAIESRLSELYGAEIEPFVRKRGDCQLFGFVSEFCDDRFVPDTRVFDGVVKLLSELLMYPKTKNGRLTEEYVLSEKQNLLDSIRAEINDKQSYAREKLIAAMFSGEPFAVPVLGTEDTAERISVSTLTRHYHTVLRESKIEIFYCGGLDFDTVKRTLVSAFSYLPRLPKTAENHTLWHEKKNSELKTVTVELDGVSQGKIALGIALGKNYHRQSLAALRVFNALFGGGVTSRLFRNVREKLSLCYYASSAVDSFKGILTVSCGVDKAKFSAAVEEILHQLEDVRLGRFSEKELADAKNAVISVLRRTDDDQAASERYYVDTFADGIFFTPAEMVELTKNVTAADIVAIGETVSPDTLCFLCGKDNCDDENGL